MALFVGLPFLAKTAAEKLPNGLLNEASQSTLDALDYLAFEPSQLPGQTKEIISMINENLSHSGNILFKSYSVRVTP